MDKRAVKTRANIESSFIELLENKAIDEITVTEIAQKSDLNRRTFYIHYDDIYDLQNKAEQHVLDEFSNMVEAYSDKINSLEYFQHVLSYVFENIKPLGILCRNPNSSLMNNLLHLTINRGKEIIPFKDEEVGEFVLSYICWGLIGYLHKLFLSRNGFDKNNTETISNLINSSIRPYLKDL